MEFIKGFTYGYDSRRGDYLRPEARESLRTLRERDEYQPCYNGFSGPAGYRPVGSD